MLVNKGECPVSSQRVKCELFLFGKCSSRGTMEEPLPLAPGVHVPGDYCSLPVLCIL